MSTSMRPDADIDSVVPLLRVAWYCLGVHTSKEAIAGLAGCVERVKCICSPVGGGILWRLQWSLYRLLVGQSRQHLQNRTAQKTPRRRSEGIWDFHPSLQLH